jgi:hypothetical protein
VCFTKQVQRIVNVCDDVASVDVVERVVLERPRFARTQIEHRIDTGKGSVVKTDMTNRFLRTPADIEF